MTSITPAAIIMWLCTLPNRCSIVPPKAAVPLNRPRYAPMCPLPSKALVTKVKGMAKVAAQAQPMRIKGTNMRYLSVTKGTSIKPMPPNKSERP